MPGSSICDFQYLAPRSIIHTRSQALRRPMPYALSVPHTISVQRVHSSQYHAPIPPNDTSVPDIA
eukprot:1644687-Rhodomonas_salina.1